MTVETLKPFIKAPVEAADFKRSNGSKNALVCHSVVLAVFYAGLLGFVIWNSVRVSTLQKEVKHLNMLLDTMQKRLGIGFLDDLPEFEEAYGNAGSVIPDKGFFNMGDEDDDDPDLYEPELNDMEDGDEDYMDDELYGGSSEEEDLFRAANATFKDDMDESIYDDLDDTDLDDMEYKMAKEGDTDDSTDRRARSITARSGVPVVAEPYQPRVNKTATEGQGTVEPTMKYDWNEKREQYLERKHKKYMEMRSRPATIVQAEHHNKGDNNQHSSSQQSQPRTTQTRQHTIHTRPNRVMHTDEGRNKAFGQDKASSYPGQVVLTGTRRRVTRPLHKSLDGRGRHRSVAIHYVGDTSRYIAGHHPHYEGNGRLKHNGGVYVDWSVDPSITNTNQFFRMENGIVTVHDTGIYLVYAQLFYHDDHDTNGFRIEKNGVPFAMCTTATHTKERVTKSNTCYTSGVTLLKAQENIRIADLGFDRHVILDPVRSFFGLVKLGSPLPASHNGNQHPQPHEEKLRMLN